MEAALKDVLADIFGVEADRIDDGFTSENVQFWDSLNHLRMVTALEERFGVTFSMDEIGNMTGYAAIVELLRNRTLPQ